MRWLRVLPSYRLAAYFGSAYSRLGRNGYGSYRRRLRRRRLALGGANCGVYRGSSFGGSAKRRRKYCARGRREDVAVLCVTHLADWLLISNDKMKLWRSPMRINIFIPHTGRESWRRNPAICESLRENGVASTWLHICTMASADGLQLVI